MIFQVLLPAPTADRPNPGIRLVAERFSWGAALLPPIWALVHGLWIELLAILVALVALGFLSLWIGDAAVGSLYLLAAILLGFEAPAIRAAAAARQGAKTLPDILASDADFAELTAARRHSDRGSLADGPEAATDLG